MSVSVKYSFNGSPGDISLPDSNEKQMHFLTQRHISCFIQERNIRTENSNPFFLSGTCHQTFTVGDLKGICLLGSPRDKSSSKSCLDSMLKATEFTKQFELNTRTLKVENISVMNAVKKNNSIMSRLKKWRSMLVKDFPLCVFLCAASYFIHNLGLSYLWSSRDWYARVQSPVSPLDTCAALIPALIRAFLAPWSQHRLGLEYILLQFRFDKDLPTVFFMSMDLSAGSRSPLSCLPDRIKGCSPKHPSWRNRKMIHVRFCAWNDTWLKHIVPV